MIRTLLLLLTPVLCGFGWNGSDGALSVAAPQPVKDSIGVPDGYRLVWHDEFEQDTVLNAEDWTHEVWAATGAAHREWMNVPCQLRWKWNMSVFSRSK